jgi:hypothetical protein
MKNKNLLLSIVLFLLCTSPSFADEKKETISLKSAVIFNTMCSKCHEGQCSGRLSFDTGSDAAKNHIKRYSGDSNISKTDVKEFFTLLNYMKKECRLFMPNGIVYKKRKLSDFATSSYTRYFIPLGTLDGGAYVLHIKVKNHIHFTFEIISDQFDSYLNSSFCPNEKKSAFDVVLDDNMHYFLRIKSNDPIQFSEITIKRVLNKNSN